jgi:hypothetical protein
MGEGNGLTLKSLAAPCGAGNPSQWRLCVYACAAWGSSEHTILRLVGRTLCNVSIADFVMLRSVLDRTSMVSLEMIRQKR